MNIELVLDGKVAKMKIEGILNSENAYLLQEKLTEVFNSDATLLELDLLDCRNISSTGIGKILLFYKDCYFHVLVLEFALAVPAPQNKFGAENYLPFEQKTPA